MNVTLNTDTAETVLRLACLTDDRSPGEQKALAELAWRIDQKRNALVTTNKRLEAGEPASDLLYEFDLLPDLNHKQTTAHLRRLEAWRRA